MLRRTCRYLLLDSGDNDPAIEFRMRQVQQAEPPAKGRNGKTRPRKLENALSMT